MRWTWGVVVVLLLTGCGTVASPARSTSTAEPTLVSTPSLGPVGTVLATGHFDPAEGVTGTVELLVGEGGISRLRITGFSSALDRKASLNLSPFPLTPERTCLDGYGIEVGSPADGDQTLPVGDLSKFGGDDPSFIDGAVIAMYVESDRREHDCGRTILARAPFVWSIPDLHPGLTASPSPTSSTSTRSEAAAWRSSMRTSTSIVTTATRPGVRGVSASRPAPRPRAPR